MGTELVHDPLGNLQNMSPGTPSATLKLRSGDSVTGAAWEDLRREAQLPRQITMVTQ